MIKISVKGLANYMTSGASTQRKVLMDYKYPKPEGKAQAAYYREARKSIETYHREDQTPQWLSNQALKIQSDSVLTANTQRRARLANNARALLGYVNNFGSVDFEVLPSVKAVYAVDSVNILVTPDLHVADGGKEKFIKFEFSAKPLDSTLVKIVSQIMFEAIRAQHPGVPSSAIVVMDAAHGEVYKGAKLGAKVAKDIEAACKTIAAVWPTI